ncbi:MAG: hypothetical protein ACYCQI_13100 [Gammaproteobacteria bacterium]
MLINQKSYKVVFTEVSTNPSLILLSGLMSLIVGLLIVVGHNVWVADWRVVITIIGWLSLLKGIVRTVFPDFVARSVIQAMRTNTVYYVSEAIILVLGIYLTYMGYMASF